MNPGQSYPLTIEPVTRKNWDKFVQLFGDKGACGNCWCMYYRLSKAAYHEGKTDDGNKKAMQELVWKGKPVGLIALVDSYPVAWCALAPREDFIKLQKSRVHKPIDDEKVWSIPCLFIDKKFRKIGLSLELLKGAVEYARKNNIKILEAYPTIPTRKKLPDSFLWIGLYSTFEQAGFKIVDRSSQNRPMVRWSSKSN